MGMQLYFSNRIENLLDRLSEVLALENAHKPSPFIASLVIVPNLNLKKWLKLGLARKQSILMNLGVEYLEEGLWRLMSCGVAPSGKLLSQNLRVILLFHLLSRLDGENSAFGPLFRYLSEAENRKGPDYPLRLWQLAGRLAFLFREYEYHRFTMIRNWKSGAEEASDSALEKCQRNLYRLMCGSLETVSRQSDDPYMSLLEMAGQFFSIRPLSAREPGIFHIFGFSQISRVHLDLIHRLSDTYDIHIYTLNPCGEFWEDITARAETPPADISDHGARVSGAEPLFRHDTLSSTGNDLLALWGKPGREHIQLLSQMTAYDTDWIAEENPLPPETVLHHLQHNILHLRQVSPQRCRQDRSLQIFGCPGRLREVETVYNSILYNLHQDDTLQLTDIAVLVPDVKPYKPLLDLVFNRSPRAIAYSVVDIQAETESIFGQGITALLHLSSGRFSRKPVFAVLLNPCMMQRWGYTADDVTVWVRWVENLNIFHGFDRHDKAGRGYPESDVYTWKKGLLRLRFSRILSDAREQASEDPKTLFRDYEGITPYCDMDTSDLELLERFNIIIERLYRELSSLTRFHGTAAQWKARLTQLSETFLEIPPEARGEHAVQEALFSALDDLCFLDRIDSDTRLSLPMIREFIASRLGVISGGYGDYLTGGVTVSALMPMRPIPFRLLYMMGMQEGGGFPGKPESDILDIRLARRYPGDSNTPEKNCYLFLETLLSAREKLYISYIARDLQRDQVIAPSSPVSRLRRHVETCILPEGETFGITEIPLKGSDPAYLNPSSVNQTSDVLVNFSLIDRLMHYREHGLWEAVKENLSKHDVQRLKTVSPDFFQAKEPSLPPETPSLEITVTQLRKFLEDPVVHVLRRFLEIFEPEESIEEKAEREDEYFFPEFPYNYQLIMNPLSLWVDSALLHGVDRACDLTAVTSEFFEHYRENGCTSEGVFGKLDRESLIDEVLKRKERLHPLISEICSQATPSCCAVNIGEAPASVSFEALPTVLNRFPAVPFLIETLNQAGEPCIRQVRLHGRGTRLWQDIGRQRHMLTLAGTRRRPDSSYPDRYVLEPLLFLMLLALADPRPNPSETIHIHIAYPDRITHWIYNIASESSRSYFAHLLSDYLAHPPLFWLPFSEVQKALKQSGLLPPGEPEPAEGKRVDFRDRLLEAFENADNPLVVLAKPEIPENAYEIAWRRMVPFYTVADKENAIP